MQGESLQGIDSWNYSTTASICLMLYLVTTSEEAAKFKLHCKKYDTDTTQIMFNRKSFKIIFKNSIWVFFSKNVVMHA